MSLCVAFNFLNWSMLPRLPPSFVDVDHVLDDGRDDVDVAFDFDVVVLVDTVPNSNHHVVDCHLFRDATDAGAVAALMLMHFDDFLLHFFGTPIERNACDHIL